MTGKERIKRYARELLNMSLDDGRVDPERVEAVLATLEKAPPRNYLSILRAYAKRVARELARGQAVIEYAGGLEDSAAEALAASFSRHYGRAITPIKRPNPDLIAGLRIRVDCDVYEHAVASRLHSLARDVA